MADVLEQVIADLKDVGVKRQREVAAEIGVPYGTLRKIVDRVTPNPRYQTVERLRAYYLRPRKPA